MPRQDVGPFQDNKYSDIFWSSLYGTLCGFGFAEVRLIWMRSSAFLIAHAAFLGLIGRGNLDDTLLALLAIAGILLAGLWMVMNSAGWMNQNRWYWNAARMNSTHLGFKLPTEKFSGEQVPKPFGPIFMIAQSLCVVFVLAYSGLLAYALWKLTTSIGWSVFWGIAAAAVAVIGSLVGHRCLYERVKADIL